ncbi:uncharacterized protein LOC128641703 [Bombina bombina]|uniref:uncharacterized protein LOC128641703 n=1 Tax=Bombina bombina TaxID=8345 RepID=UPI00235AC3D4|nr:uncharacterized protein LOC128641703 [Bombina bombina]
MEFRGFLFFVFLHQASAVLELTAVPQSANVGANILIPCTFSVDKLPINPELLAIVWYFQGKEILSYDTVLRTSHPTASLNTSMTKEGVASLSLSNLKIFDSGIYKCLVFYSQENKEKEVMVDVYATPTITITNNVVEKNKESVLKSTITGFYPIDIDIKWLSEKEVLKSVHYTPQKNSDGTYSLKSSVTITPTDENENQTYSIRVLHASLQEPLQKNFRLEYEGNKTYQTTSLIAVFVVIISLLLIVIPVIIVCKRKSKKKDVTGRAVTPNKTITIPGDIVTQENMGRIERCPRPDKSGEPLLAKRSQTSDTFASGGDCTEKNIKQPADATGRDMAPNKTLTVPGDIVTQENMGRIEKCPRPDKSGETLLAKRSQTSDTFASGGDCSEENVKQPAGQSDEEALSVLNKSDEIDPDVTGKAVTPNKTIAVPGDIVTQENMGRIERCPRPDKSGEPLLAERSQTSDTFASGGDCTEKNIKQPTGPKAPEVEDIEIHMLGSSEAEYQCKCSKYFPDDLRVTWYQKEKGGGYVPVDKAKCNIPVLPQVKQPDGTYTCTARLITSSQNSESGLKFMCSVEHSTLKMSIIRRER